MDYYDKEFEKLKEELLDLTDKFKSGYTGFTTRCKKCNQDVVCKREGTTEDGHPFFRITCGCSKK